MKTESKPEGTIIEIKPDVFVPSKRKQASKALALRDRGKARIRYEKKPTKKDGNPFFAVRVPRPLLAAFKRHAKTKKTTPAALVREYMSKLTGVVLDDGDGEA